MSNGYYGTSEAASTAVMILVAEAEAYAAAAKLSEDAAEISENNAEASAVIATDASSNVAAGVLAAAASANAASTSENNAAASANAASTSETNAAASETAASNSATAAATSETNASTSAATATTKASEASTSATASAASATSASASATSATASAATATTKASEASTSASQAASSATSSATSATAASNSATAAATSETNAATSATSASNSATAAATSETNAEASETSAAADAAIATTKASEASTSASEAATSSTSASNSATSATASATTATTKASEASTSEVNAAASAASSAASYDDFDDRYLGAKATDPTVDNDGNAIITGALYFNTTDDVMKVYEGTSWIAAYASLSGAALLTGADFTGAVSAPDFIGPLNGAIQFTAKNTSGGTITEGQVVCITGLSGNTPEVDLADADNLSVMPAFGLAGSTATNDNTLEIVTFGSIHGIQTNYSGWALGDILYVSTTAGVLTNIPPTGEAAKIQNIGTVERLHSSNGTIKVGGAGRTNATPNLDNGNFFLGNASNQSVTASFNTSVTGIALPLSGGAMTGAITTSSTFDGRDVSADGSKLDGIETGATADQTAAQLLTAIKTVDGAGSGLDADLLDGISSGSFLRSDANDSVNAGSQLLFNCTAGSTGEASNWWPIEVKQTTLNADALMSFHVAGDYAVHFGIDGSTNKLSVGGWYMGANMYEIWHAGTVDLSDSGWINPTLGNGFAVYAGQTVSYRKKAGIVYVRGYVSLGTAGTSPFTLPSGYRPSIKVYASNAANAFGSGATYVNVSTAGVVTAGDSYTSLDLVFAVG